MQSALERDQALALLESCRTPKRAAALSRLTYHQSVLSHRSAVRRAAARRAHEKSECSVARATLHFLMSPACSRR